MRLVEQLTPNDLEGLDDDDTSRTSAPQGRRIDWIRTLLVAFALLGVGLIVWQGLLPGSSRNDTLDCIAYATFLGDEKQACSKTLRALVASVPPNAGATCPLKPTTGVWAFEEKGSPRLFIWLDNLFVDVYTIMFIAIAARAWAALANRPKPLKYVIDFLFLATLSSCILGALADHAENFWSLAHIGTPECSYIEELEAVGGLAKWKFRLFAANVILAVGWSLARVWSRR